MKNLKVNLKHCMIRRLRGYYDCSLQSTLADESMVRRIASIFLIEKSVIISKSILESCTSNQNSSEAKLNTGVRDLEVTFLRFMFFTVLI